MLTSYDFSEQRVNAALDRIEKARKEQRKKNNQMSLDQWFR